MKIPEKLTSEQISSIYSKIRVNKTTFYGKDIQIIGGAIAALENVVNSVKKAVVDIQIQLTYHHSRKEIKSILRSKVESNLESFKNTIDVLEDKLSNPVNQEQADVFLECAKKFEEDLIECREAFKSIKSKKEIKHSHVPQLLKECDDTIKSFFAKSQHINLPAQTKEPLIVGNNPPSAEPDIKLEMPNVRLSQAPSVELQKVPVEKIEVSTSFQPSITKAADLLKIEKALAVQSLSEEESKKLLEDLQQALKMREFDKADAILAEHPTLIDTPLADGKLLIHHEIHRASNPANSVDLLSDDVDHLLLEQDPVIYLINKGADLSKTDQDGCNAFNHAAQAHNEYLAREMFFKIMEKGKTELKEISEKVDKITAKTKAEIDLCSMLNPEAKKILSAHMRYGHKGHNMFLREAIEAGNIQQVVRLLKDGARLDSQDPKTNQSLLHLACSKNIPEIVLYLLQRGLLQTYPDKNGKIAKDIALENKNDKILTLLEQYNSKKVQSPLKEQSELLLQIEKEYEIEKKNYPTALTKHKRNIATYSNKSGHHLGLEVCILKGDTEGFIEWAEGGVPVNTINIPFSYNEDPAKSRYSRIRERLPESLKSQFPEGFTQYGRGESLLHLAVKNNSHEIIQYLMNRGLNPMQEDANGVTPIAIAQSSGNLKALCLLTQGRGVHPTSGSWLWQQQRYNKAVNTTLDILMEASRNSDPLHITLFEKMEFGFAAIFFLTQLGIIDGAMGYLNILPLFILLYNQVKAPLMAYYSDSKEYYRPEFQDTLRAVAEDKANPLSQRVREVYSFISKGSILESATYSIVNSLPIFNMSSLAIRTYQNAMLFFPTFKTAKRHFATRPIQAMIKGGIHVIKTTHLGASLLQTMSRMVSPWFTPRPCQPLDPKDFADASDPISMLSQEKFDPKCPAHVRTLFNRSEWEGKSILEIDEKDINKQFRRWMMIVHPDKFKGDETLSQNLNVAKDTFFQAQESFKNAHELAKESTELYNKLTEHETVILKPELLAEKFAKITQAEASLLGFLPESVVEVGTEVTKTAIKAGIVYKMRQSEWNIWRPLQLSTPLLDWVAGGIRDTVQAWFFEPKI